MKKECGITREEYEYIKNDIKVVAEALQKEEKLEVKKEYKFKIMLSNGSIVGVKVIHDDTYLATRKAIELIRPNCDVYDIKHIEIVECNYVE